MNFKKNIIAFSSKNLLLSESLYYIAGINDEHEMESLLQMLAKEDTIEDQKSLYTLKYNILNYGKLYWSHDIHKTNSRLYGIGKALFPNFKGKNIWLPSIEHGLIFHDRNWSDTSDTYRGSCVTFGPFRKKILQRYYNCPIFEVGPYIQYATDYYDNISFAKLKTQLGKTLLVFPSHSTDQDFVSFDCNLYLQKIKETARNYDSVLVCVYWWNIDDPFIKLLSAQGYKIVSAGFREDYQFLRRLKTIIKLSDAVLSDSVGTHIGYCESLQKPVELIDIYTKYKLTFKNDLNFMQKQFSKIRMAFSGNNSKNKEKILNYYWGLGIKRTNKELEAIVSINKSIEQRSKYFTYKYQYIAESLLGDYEKHEPFYYSLLQSALCGSDHLQNSIE